MQSNKPEANDGDLDTFYSFDPSKLFFFLNIFRQIGPDKQFEFYQAVGCFRSI
jgi:hypothetical protein